MPIKIDLYILGVEKSGTTALFRHLAQSHKIYAHEQREFFYFISDDEYRKGWKYACDKYFPEFKSGFVIAKNVMEINSAKSMTRLKKQLPNVKCIIMLREPASRAYSAYNYAVLRGAEDCLSFEQALNLEEKRIENDSRPDNPLLYISNSTYSEKINRAYKIFGKENVLVIYNEDYINDPKSQIQRIENLLGETLFDGVEVKFNSYNKAARAKYKWLARVIYRILRSKNPAKKVIREILPHKIAVNMRHRILNFNRVESPNQPLSNELKEKITKKLESDKNQLISLIGYCPWK